jgi:hypothetical protein
MIVAIQQPEHLPWIGFFNKMIQSDLYVFLDNVQFKKRYFENRNRIKTRDDIKWLTVPVKSKGKYTQRINEVEIDNSTFWQKRYLGLFEHAYKKCPYWKDIKEIVYRCINQDNSKLVNLNLKLIKECGDYLQINTPTVLASELGLDSFSDSELIREICLTTKADTYISGSDGRSYLKLNKFNLCGINVIYHDFEHPIYPQMYRGFVSHMSIIDLIGNCGNGSSKIVRDCYAMDIKNEI